MHILLIFCFKLLIANEWSVYVCAILALAIFIVDNKWLLRLISSLYLNWNVIDFFLHRNPVKAGTWTVTSSFDLYRVNENTNFMNNCLNNTDWWMISSISMKLSFHVKLHRILVTRKPEENKIKLIWKTIKNHISRWIKCLQVYSTIVLFLLINFCHCRQRNMQNQKLINTKRNVYNRKPLLLMVLDYDTSVVNIHNNTELKWMTLQVK